MVKILEIIDLTYKDFNNINLSFEENKTYSIIGSNNCGKTTLFKLISGFLPSNNTIFCNNIVLNSKSMSEYIVNLGVVERVNKNSFIFNSVFDEMMYPLRNLGFSKKYCNDKINEILELFNANKFIDKKIGELDVYEKQLLLIMIAILHEPKVLLIDNVLETLPIAMQKKVITVLKSLELTIINFTTNLGEAYLCDKIILMDKFKIIGEFVPSDIYKDDKLFYEHNLEIPFITDLAIKLKMYNLVKKNYDDMKAMVDDIWP